MKLQFKSSVNGTPYTISITTKKGILEIMFYPLVHRLQKGGSFWNFHMAAPTISAHYIELGQELPKQYVSDEELDALCWRLEKDPF